jgi:hypothetical protein
MATATPTVCRWWNYIVVPSLLDDADKVSKLPTEKRRRWTCTKGCVQAVRPGLVAFVLIAMLVWLFVDVFVLDALVPGAKDTYMVEAIKVPPASMRAKGKDEIWKWYTDPDTSEKDAIYSCPCAHDKDGLMFLPGTTRGTPYARLIVTREANNWAEFNIAVSLFMMPCNGSAFNLSSEGGRKAAAEASKFIWAASHVRLRPQEGSLLLTKHAWQTSRMAGLRSECWLAETVACEHMAHLHGGYDFIVA